MVPDHAGRERDEERDCGTEGGHRGQDEQIQT